MIGQAGGFVSANVHSSVSGKVIEVNAELEGAPESVNTDPYGAGWMIKVEMSNPAEYDELLDAAAYEAECK